MQLDVKTSKLDINFKTFTRRIEINFEAIKWLVYQPSLQQNFQCHVHILSIFQYFPLWQKKSHTNIRIFEKFHIQRCQLDAAHCLTDTALRFHWVLFVSLLPAKSECMLSWVLFNARNVCNKLPELYYLLYSLSYDIIMITESWLNVNVPDSILDPRNHFCFPMWQTNIAWQWYMCVCFKTFECSCDGFIDYV